ncbi:MAG TPA: BBE domain-containing protein, partial [Actinopolymorphaceae bacterium]
PSDPHHDVWWAHTGGGGGSFGVITRFWLRSPDAKGSDPSDQLPKPPAKLLTNLILWDWNAITRDDFIGMIRNFVSFYERHNTPDSKYASLYTPMLISHKSTQQGFLCSNQLDGTLPDAEKLLKDFTDTVTKGLEDKSYVTPPLTLPFMSGTLQRSIAESYAGARSKYKAGYLRKSYDSEQLGLIYDRMTETENGTRDSTFLLVPYGGKVNTVPPDATATAQRDSCVKAVAVVNWENPADDEKHIRWLREFYRDLYADTGGVPVSNEVNDGSYINYPDRDLTDPTWNTSGVPWYTLYFKDNYRRLQRVKAAYDPKDVFRHALSVRLPS